MPSNTNDVPSMVAQALTTYRSVSERNGTSAPAESHDANALPDSATGGPLPLLSADIAAGSGGDALSDGGLAADLHAAHEAAMGTPMAADNGEQTAGDFVPQPLPTDPKKY